MSEHSAHWDGHSRTVAHAPRPRRTLFWPLALRSTRLRSVATNGLPEFVPERAWGGRVSRSQAGGTESSAMHFSRRQEGEAFDSRDVAGVSLFSARALVTLGEISSGWAKVSAWEPRTIVEPT